jgi:hypothetical protein
VNSAGFSTTVLPAASAGGIFIASDSSGAFQVMMIATTPNGSGMVKTSGSSLWVLEQMPSSRSAQPA